MERGRAGTRASPLSCPRMRARAEHGLPSRPICRVASRRNRTLTSRACACVMGCVHPRTVAFGVGYNPDTVRIYIPMAGRPRTRSGKVCGARNRRGLPCQCKLLFRGGRCRFHGGLSTGPRTEEGRRRALLAMRTGWLAWRTRHEASGRAISPVGEPLSTHDRTNDGFLAPVLVETIV